MAPGDSLDHHLPRAATVCPLPLQRALLALSVLLLMLPGTLARGQAVQPAFTPRRVVRPMPAIVDVPVLPADQIEDQVTDNELVLGVVVGGQARAYPINMLTGPRREIINDMLGGRAIAATW